MFSLGDFQADNHGGFMPRSLAKQRDLNCVPKFWNSYISCKCRGTSVDIEKEEKTSAKYETRLNCKDMCISRLGRTDIVLATSAGQSALPNHYPSIIIRLFIGYDVIFRNAVTDWL